MDYATENARFWYGVPRIFTDGQIYYLITDIRETVAGAVGLVKGSPSPSGPAARAAAALAPSPAGSGQANGPCAPGGKSGGGGGQGGLGGKRPQ